MGAGANILLMMMLINIGLIMIYPAQFGLTESIEKLDYIGLDVNVTVNETTGEFINVTLNNTDTDNNQTSTLLGYGEENTETGFWSGITDRIFDPILKVGGAVRWGMSMLYAPVTISEKLEAPWWISLMFSIVITTMYFIALLSFIRGYEF